jgi:hypothetical protein
LFSAVLEIPTFKDIRGNIDKAEIMSENFGILSLMSLLNLSNTPSSALVDSALEWLVKLDLPEKFIEEFKESYKFSTATPSDIEDEESYPFTSLIQFADKDMISSQSHREALNALVSAGVMQGSGGYLNPLAPVTRAEAAVMLSRALRIVNYLSSHKEFDVKILDVPEDHWAFEDIKFAYYHGVVNGTEVIDDTTFSFSPNAPLTYEALGLMIENACDALGWNKVRSAEDKNLSMYSPWAVDGAYWVTDGKEPGSTASREDFALMVFEFLTYDY